MDYIEGKIYKWNFGSYEQSGKFTGKLDTAKGFEGNLIMENDKGILWSVEPKYIVNDMGTVMLNKE